MFIFETHIKSIQKRVAKFINQKLMPLLGLANVEFYFPPMNINNEEVVLRVARSMIDGGISGPGLEHPALVFLKENGFTIPSSTTIEDPKVKDINTMPSRLGAGRDTRGTEEKDKRDNTGDSKESKDKLNKAEIRKTMTEAIANGDFNSWFKNREV